MGLIAVVGQDPFIHLLTKNPEILPASLGVCRATRQVALEILSRANRAILGSHPSWEADLQNLSSSNPVHIFMRLINHLRDEANRLGCNVVDFRKCPEGDRFSLEWMYFPQLMNELKGRTSSCKQEDFEKFIRQIVQDLKIPLPEGTNLSDFWNQSLVCDERVRAITVFKLENQSVRFLPKEIEALTGLKQLFLNGNKLNELPQEVSQLSRLIALNLNDNLFYQLPTVIVSLTALRHLRVMNNQVQEIPPSFQLPRELEYVDLSENPLGSIPANILSLSKLTRLAINSAEIQQVPSSLTILQRLKVLSLGNNQLTTFDPTLIEQLAQLETLFLRQNPLDPKTCSAIVKKAPLALEVEM